MGMTVEATTCLLRSSSWIGMCKVTDVLNRESALASSLNPVNPWASKGEKQFKATGALCKALYPTVVYKWLMVNLAKSWKGKVQWAISNFGGRSAYKMFVYDEEFKAEVLAVSTAPRARRACRPSRARRTNLA